MKLWCVRQPVCVAVTNASQRNGKLLQSTSTVVPGDIVATYFNTHQENIIWFWSIIAAGGIPAVLSSLAKDPRSRGAQVGNYVEILQSPTVITNTRLKPELSGFDVERVVAVETLQKAALSGATTNGAVKNGTMECCEDSDRHATKRIKLSTPKPSPLQSQIAVLLFTSGSTGHAKAVEFSHSQLIASVKMKSALHKIDSDMNFMSWTCKRKTSN